MIPHLQKITSSYSGPTQRFTAYVRGSDSRYTAQAVTVPVSGFFDGGLEKVGPVVLTGTQHGFRSTVADLFDAAGAMRAEADRLEQLALGLQTGEVDGPADWLAMLDDGMSSFRSAA